MKTYAVMSKINCLLGMSESLFVATQTLAGNHKHKFPTLDITWLADANAAGTTMTWANANAWAAALDVNGVIS